MKSLRDDSVHFFIRPKYPKNILKIDSSPHFLFESNKVGSRVVNEMLPKLSKALGLRKLTNPMIKPINLKLNGDQLEELNPNYKQNSESREDVSNEVYDIQSDNVMELDIKNEIFEEEFMDQNSTKAMS